MIAGLVNTRLEPVVRLQVLGPRGQAQEVAAAIDTGYNGALTMPLAIVGALALVAGARRQVTLGDASRKSMDFYRADILWDGQVRTAYPSRS
jgi:predicted aspartyl protease